MCTLRTANPRPSEGGAVYVWWSTCFCFFPRYFQSLTPHGPLPSSVLLPGSFIYLFSYAFSPTCLVCCSDESPFIELKNHLRQSFIFHPHSFFPVRKFLTPITVIPSLLLPDGFHGEFREVYGKTNASPIRAGGNASPEGPLTATFTVGGIPVPFFLAHQTC